MIYLKTFIGQKETIQLNARTKSEKATEDAYRKNALGGHLLSRVKFQGSSTQSHHFLLS